MFICKIDACDHILGIRLIIRKCYWIEIFFFHFTFLVFHKRGRGVCNVFHCEGKCPSCTSEGNDRLSKTNDTTFEFIAKEEEVRDFCVNLMWEKRDVFRVNISLT